VFPVRFPLGEFLLTQRLLDAGEIAGHGPRDRDPRASHVGRGASGCMQRKWTACPLRR
jgi:hypothetical protein